MAESEKIPKLPGSELSQRISVNLCLVSRILCKTLSKLWKKKILNHFLGDENRKKRVRNIQENYYVTGPYGKFSSSSIW